MGKDAITHCNEITVEEMLGEGSFAQVFKISLTKKKMSGCVSKHTCAHMYACMPHITIKCKWFDNR